MIKHSLTIFLIFVASIFCNPAQSQVNADLPFTFVPAQKETGDLLVLYISGDGGWNTFSQKLAAQYAASGNPVIALNSLKYFWNKKTPEQVAIDIGNLLEEFTGKSKKKRILLCGYSFGADVLPFIYTRFSKELKDKVSAVQLLSPSAFTDFEIHVSYLFISKKMDVAAEVQKINKPVICYYGSSEKEKPLQGLEMKNFKTIILRGNHHYNDSFVEIVETGLKP